MARKAREKSLSGIYAVLLRPADKEGRIFIDDDDYNEFISRMRSRFDGALTAFALTAEAVCMILRESEAGIGFDIRSLTVGYARYYGAKYGRAGGIFGQRFRSEPVETGGEMAAQTACIHRLCDILGARGRTGCRDDDGELYIPGHALEFMGGIRAYENEMNNAAKLTKFYSILSPDAKRRAVKSTKGESAAPAGNKAAHGSEKVSKKKKNKNMPSWLL